MSRSLMEALESRTLLAAIGDAANDEGAPRPHVIDLMVLYTPAAATDPGGVVALNRRVRREVADTNQILANSLIDITIRLVHVGEVQHEEPADGDIGVSLAELSSRADVQAVREQYGADLVTFWLATGFAGGMAYLPGPPGSPAPGNGFNVVVDSSANNDFTLAHELGHNLGAIHGGAIKFRVDETAMWPYTDVMGSWDPVPFYSNPHVSFHGVPLGIEGRRDNASTMRAHAPDVASYMPTRVTADAPPSRPSGPSGSRRRAAGSRST